LLQRSTFTLAVALAVITVADGGGSLSRAAEPGTPAQRQAARRLFSEGLADVDAQRWTEATDHFAGAYALSPTPEIAYNLASALMRIGELAQASRLLTRVSDDAAARPEVREAARARLAELTPPVSTPPSTPALATTPARPSATPVPLSLSLERDVAPQPAPSLFHRGWFWAAVGSVAVASLATAFLVSRGGPAELRGNVDTWDLRR
jgi:hypothetical protein